MPASARVVVVDADDHDEFVDNNGQATELANKVSALREGVDDDKKRRVFSIVGFGGLGKTNAGEGAQVAVSQTFSGKDLQGLLRRVLRQITQPIVDRETVDDAEITQLQAAAASSQPNVNIDTMDVDDLATELKKRLDNKSPLDVNLRLDDTESKQLFISKAFGSKSPCPDDLKDAMESILKKCSGLPLAIVSIASLLANYKPPEGKEMWETIKNSIGSQMENNPTLEGMRQILTLSYNHLPHHLKACMMYLSIFPEDYMIAKDRLLKRWISEGLIVEKRGLCQMDLAEGYFNELVSRNMVDMVISKATFNLHQGIREDQFRVHDMMLEILVSKSLESNFVSLVGEFTLLRVLDLEDCTGLTNKHMSCICRMYLLRFLSLRGTDVKVMPSRIGDLEHLQMLDVRQTQLKDLPKSVTKLEKLEHLLFFDQGDSGWMLPQGINKMKALRQLKKAAVVFDAKVAEEIGELGQLQELAIFVDTGKKMNNGVVKKLASSLSKMYSLRWLDIGNLDAEPPPQLLRYLRICGHMNRLPDWVESLHDLVELQLRWTHVDGFQLFNVLCKLPNLKRLFLGSYFIHGKHMVVHSSQHFRELKELILGYTPSSCDVYEFEEGSMPNVERLVVYFGDQTKKIVGIEHFKKLKEVEYIGSKDNLRPVLEPVEQMNNKRDVSQRITIKVRYDW
uniref:Uncharacterized protein n=1 Tax=Oryza rufipogon TaxID=4529 RepID=A0A0E0RE98_ORYRU